MKSSDQDRVEAPEMNWFLEHLSSAQYLDMDPLLWHLLMEQRIEIIYEIAFPNLHTLMKKGWIQNESFYHIQALIPNHTSSTLRRLSIRHDVLPDTIIPIHWITLTHISIQSYIPLNFWFSLLRAVPDLQWGYFHIQKLISIGKDYTRSTRCTLSRLSTLFITVHSLEGNGVEFPLSLLFTNIYLPALCTLSLSSHERSWRDHWATIELYTVLQASVYTGHHNAYPWRTFSLIVRTRVQYSDCRCERRGAGLEPCNQARASTA